MLSIGELLDKLIIENIKIFNIREKLHHESLEDKDYLSLNNKMMTLNDNKTIVIEYLNSKIEKVLSNEEVNRVFNTIKTY